MYHATNYSGGERRMRLSKLAGKEIINLQDGGRLGVVAETDLVVHPETGELESIIIPNHGTFFSRFREEKYMVIPWQAIKKIGSEVIIVDMAHTLRREKSIG